MTQFIRYLVMANLLCGFLPQVVFAADEYKISYQRSLNDKVIENDFSEGLRWQDDRFQQSRVKAKTFNGYVLLYGEVPEEELIAIAEKHARSLKHVRRVFSQIIVDEPHQSNTIDNVVISANIKGHLWSSTDINASRVYYEVDDRTVYLMGLVDPAEANNIVSLVQSITSVDKVVTLFEYVQ